MAHQRTIEDWNSGWRFRCGGELPAQVLAHGNRNWIANETRIWQKAGNHAVSHPENPHTLDWEAVELPHDFVIAGRFSNSAPLNNGSLPGDQAWYVKTFELAADEARLRICLEFDAVYRDCQVFCNGHFVGRHLSGYTSFSVDISEVCLFGAPNAVAVRVDARENELWSYEGGGIYRRVRLVKTARVHIPQWGVYVRTGEADDPGRTAVEVCIRNRDYQDATGEVQCRVIDAAGQTLAAAAGEFAVATMADATVAVDLRVAAPQLWAPDTPTLYTLVTELKLGGSTIDRYEQQFGYRYYHFDPQNGFFLNGSALKIKGTCCHQDHAGVGTAVPPGLQAWRVQRLKSYGCNALRTSHNPPDPALLAACDRLGMLVMDEIRVPGIAPELLTDVADLIRRDRNHPSVILWSLGNEEMNIQHTPTGLAIFQRLLHLAKRLDPGRPTTYACNCHWLEISHFQADNGVRFDVWGANYRCDQDSRRYDQFHADFPDWPLIGSETWGGAATRGLYADDGCPLGERWRDHGWSDERRYVSAYANWATPWGYSISEMWQDCATRPFMAGTFVWTGFDYRGETSPYDYPAVVTRYGVLDLCGFDKEVAHYLRSWWLPQQPHLFLMPHWTWPGREGQEIGVRCYGNTATVELLLNGLSLGRRPMPENGQLEWQVAYVPGNLSAIGYDGAGAQVATVLNRTAGPAVATRLQCECVDDIVVANVAIVDAAGTLCPSADHGVEFTVGGPARLLGVGNGNPISHEPDQGTNRRAAYHGLCQAIYRRTAAGPITIRVAAPDLAADSWEAAGD